MEAFAQGARVCDETPQSKGDMKVSWADILGPLCGPIAGKPAPTGIAHALEITGFLDCPRKVGQLQLAASAAWALYFTGLMPLSFS
ncbi:hypothetical protein, partial [Pseudomonas putida]|uniref:hypothetical protein n=1 Tax=Pseudomonas putida TaxID=303 RepID=UPI0021697788